MAHIRQSRHIQDSHSHTFSIWWVGESVSERTSGDRVRSCGTGMVPAYRVLVGTWALRVPENARI